MARPLRGCKCGKLDHSYVNDPKCVLYRNVKGQVDPTQLKDLERVNNVKESKKRFDKYEGLPSLESRIYVNTKDVISNIYNNMNYNHYGMRVASDTKAHILC